MIAIEGIPPSMYSGMETLNIAPSTSLPNNRRGMQDIGQSSRQEPHHQHHQNNIGGQDRSMAGTSSGVGGGWSQKLKHRKEYTVLKKVVRVLQDNRMTNADQDATQRLHNEDGNGGGGNDADSYPILKTILNVIFITTGVVLLVAVFVVIIYTSIVKPNPSELEQMGQSYFNPTEEEEEEMHIPKREDSFPDEDIVITTSPLTNINNNNNNNINHHQHHNRQPTSSSSSDYQIQTSRQCRTIPIIEGFDSTIKFRELCFNVPLQPPVKSSPPTSRTFLVPRSSTPPKAQNRRAIHGKRRHHLSIGRTRLFRR